MEVAIFGLGYVGLVSACCIAEDGHRVVGVDPVQAKVDAVNAGLSPIFEPGISEMIKSLGGEGRISATRDGKKALAGADLVLVCVGTPSRSNGDLDLTHIRAAAGEIGDALALVDGYRVIAIRSTVLPGTVLGEVRETLERRSGKRAGSDFGLCFNPEFLREGTAVADYRRPSKIVIGALANDDRAVAALKGLYAELDAPLFVTSIPVAEMAKYTDNAWHAVKVAFANEIGTICKAAAIDSHDVMGMFMQDTRLNLSSYYLWPGFAFGGSCLPKDLRALTFRGRSVDLSLPLLESVIPSNRSHIDRAFDMIAAGGSKKVGICGLSFKAKTDDMRESPAVELIERLIGKGFDVRIHDPDVDFSALIGANRAYIMDRVGHIVGLMVKTVDELLAHAQVIVLAKRSEDANRAAEGARPPQCVIDLVRATEARGQCQYDGICW